MDWQRPVKGRASRTWRLAGLAAITVIVGSAAVFALLPLAVRAFVASLDLALDACIWLTMSFDAGTDPWTIIAAVGRTAARALMTRRALAAMATLVLISSLALYGLQRLLGTEEESS